MAEFSNEKIAVSPHARANLTASPGVPEAVAPGGYVEEPEPAAVAIDGASLTEADCIELSMICVNIPSMFGNPHLERSEAQCTPFGRQLYKYCLKKGIDPADWVFDEFGLVVTGVGLIGGMWSDHKAHKAANQRIEPKKDAFPDDVTIPKGETEQLPEEAEKT